MKVKMLVSAAFVAGVMLVGDRSSADVFDTPEVNNDNSYTSTGNELIHGSDQTHDLAHLPGPLADDDWYKIGQKPYSSSEVVVDATSPAIGPTLVLELVASDGVTVLASSAPVGSLGFSRSLRFINDTGVENDAEYIHVRSGGCTTTCTRTATYRIRRFDTTLALPRFNNVGTRYSYVMVQNPNDFPVDWRIRFFSATGDLDCQSELVTLVPHAQAVMDDDRIIYPGVPGPLPHELCEPGGTIEGLAGHAILISNAPYGTLRAKSTSLDPDGDLLEFDTEMGPRPY
jgi:hypothetical protein